MKEPGRTLAVETSGIAGSVALIEEGRVRAFREHTEENQHAERMLGHVQSALFELGWSKASLTRIVVSRGPGAFTGIRMGLALAQGLEMGLGIRAQTVCSLRALAATPFVSVEGHLSHPCSDTVILAVRDARRSELFVRVFDSSFRPLTEPAVLPQAGAKEALIELAAGRPCVFVGKPCLALGLAQETWAQTLRADPVASAVGLLGEQEAPGAEQLRAEYVRGPNLIKPVLPPSPLTRS